MTDVGSKGALQGKCIERARNIKNSKWHTRCCSSKNFVYCFKVVEFTQSSPIRLSNGDHPRFARESTKNFKPPASNGGYHLCKSLSQWCQHGSWADHQIQVPCLARTPYIFGHGIII